MRNHLIYFLLLLLSLSPLAASAAEKQPVKASSQEIALASGLKAREEAIAGRERELARKEQELATMSKEVEEKYAKIIAIQEDIKGKLASLNRARDQQFAGLIKIYSAMSASKVAPMLDKMEDNEAVEILRAMKPVEVAKILPKLNPEKAVRVSKRLGMM